MRRLALVFSMLLVLAACSDGGEATDTTTPPVESISAAEKTTTTSATTTEPATTTTNADTLSSTADTTADVPAAELAFETSQGTPPDEFDSFTATMSLTFEIEETPITVVADGTWIGDAFECTLSSEFGGLTFSESIIATPETLWYDQGNGYDESSLLSGSVSELVASCPAAPLFWQDFGSDDFSGLSGDVIDYNGRSAYQADFTEVLGALGGLGLTGVSSDMIEDMQVWIDEETTTIIGLYTELAVPASMLEGADAEGSTTMIMEFSLDNFNDPGLSIELP